MRFRGFLTARDCDYFDIKVVNVVLRLAWMQTVLGIKEAPFLHKRALVAVVASLEIVRRGIWNFFRFDFYEKNLISDILIVEKDRKMKFL